MATKNILIDKQIQDNIRIIDCMLRTMSTAENLAIFDKNSRNDKKYSKYDENDVCSWKTEKQIKDDFLMNIECLHTMINIFKKRHNNKNYIFPKDVTQQNILYDLNIYKMLAVKKNPSFGAYFDELKKLIQGGNCKKYSEKELLSSFEDEKEENKMDEEEVNKVGYTILSSAFIEKKRIEDKLNEYFQTGEINADLKNNFQDKRKNKFYDGKYEFDAK